MKRSKFIALPVVRPENPQLIVGMIWQKEQEGVMGFPRVHPMSDLVRGLKEHTWPDPDDERIYEKIYKKILIIFVRNIPNIPMIKEIINGFKRW